MNNFLREKAEYIRKRVFEVACKNKAGHIAPSLSCLEILVYLYYEKMWPYAEKYHFNDANKIFFKDRDRLILSKAHGGYALYAILNDLGIIPDNVFEDMGKSTSILKGCVEYHPEYGLESGCGSLGHGLPIAAGIAYGAKLNGYKYKVYCIVGDGELQEGTTWETLLFIKRMKLDNLVIIIDNNKLRAMDDNVVGAENLMSFVPWRMYGHDFESIKTVIEIIETPSIDNDIFHPLLIFAETIKGKGISCMENKTEFHYRIPGCIIE